VTDRGALLTAIRHTPDAARRAPRRRDSRSRGARRDADRPERL